MESVEGTFYFKDNSTLSVQSKKGIYNNNTLDMILKKMLEQIMKIVNYLQKRRSILIQKVF